MIKTTEMLCAELKDYEIPLSKISQMMKGGEIIQIVRGLYEIDSKDFFKQITEILYAK